MKPPNLTDHQKRRLHPLEERLRFAAQRGDYQSGVPLVKEIQEVLRPTGHEHRVQQAKAWLFEAAMESGDLSIAISGFIGIRQKVRPATRLFLEATTLLAICLIRQQKLREAEPIMREAFGCIRNIKAVARQRMFFRELVRRFEEEGALSALRGHGTDAMNAVDVENAAGNAVASRSEDEIYADIGRALPAETVAFILRVDQMARGQLSEGEVKFLPPAPELLKPKALGESAFGGLKRVLWRSLCDPESDIFKVLHREGIGAVLNKKWLGAAIVAGLAGMGIGIYALAVSTLALIIKLGIAWFCDVSRPDGIMSLRG